MGRKEFRVSCVERDHGQCVVPWCNSTVTADPDGPGEVHHIIERELWPNGGYFPDNGASVCNDHHRMAEVNEIPPQAFWRWIGRSGGYVPTKEMKEMGCAVDKWGEPFDTPPHSEMRTYPKYPSTRHLLPLYWQSERGTQEERTGRDDTGLQSVESLLDIPLVATIKMDGSNTMLVADTEEPVRARNGRDATHESFDHLKQEYWDRNVYENLPEYLQVFGENMYAKHSIHYGCDGCCDDRNQGPPVDDVFLVFGVYDTRYDIWLSWPETEEIANQIGFPTVPGAGGHRINAVGGHGTQDFHAGTYETEQEFIEYFTNRAEKVVDRGHEGIIVRSMYPFHYDQFSEKVGKYVRCNHVQTDEHWSHRQTVRNEVNRE